MNLLPIIMGVAAVLMSGCLAEPSSAADRSPPEQEHALALIAVDLPPLTDFEKRALTLRAERGDLKAIYELAHHALRTGGPMYFWGDWGDPREAEKWWRRAAALGDPKAMILLGHLYAEPWGVPQDLSEAAKWFRLAADKGRLEAVQDLAALYMGEWSDERDDDLASIWLRRAADMGDDRSMLLLALRYDAGWGVREDAREAASWYRKVISAVRTRQVNADQSVALNNLGILYEKGRGVPQDDAVAAALYRLARSDFNLARLCEVGRGVALDREGALWRYREVALFSDTPDVDQALKRLGYVRSDQEAEAGALLEHDKQKAKTTCDP
jgi:TPR repeat protein